MFEAKIANVDVLQHIVDAIKDLVVDAPFVCTNSSMSLRAMDPTHVSMVSLKMNADLFETYRCDDNFTLGVHVPELHSTLRPAYKHGPCIIKHDDSNPDSVSFTYRNPKGDMTKGSSVKKWDLEPEFKDKKMPAQDYSVIISMPSEEFQKMIHYLSTRSPTIDIMAIKSGVTFSAKGENGSASAQYMSNETVDVTVKRSVNASFPMRFMNVFTAATPLSHLVTISICDDVPVRVEYNIEDKGHLIFYLAPMVDDDDM